MPTPPSTRPPAAPPQRLSRRTVLAALSGATATAVLSGCTDGDRRRPAADRRGGLDRADRAAPVEDVDPDVAVAAAALAAELQVLTALEATVRAHRRLRTALAPAAEVHRAHVELLAGAVPADTATGDTNTAARRVPRDPGRALARLVRSEEELSAAGRRHAFTAESGPFARLLASMAASAAQQAALLGNVTLPEQRARR